MKKTLLLFVVLWTSGIANFSAAQMSSAEDRRIGEGPYSQLIIRGVTLINGTGAPPFGPVDIVIKRNRIENIIIVGYPGVAIDSAKRPKLEEGGTVLAAEGMYLLPGFIDMHAHIGGKSQGTTPDYVFKLWMAHGITTVREPSCGNGLDWTLTHKERSNNNEIVAPRIKAYPYFGQGSKLPISTPQMARDWVRIMADKGVDGIKFFGTRPDIMDAALEEAKKYHLRSACHHAQLNVAWLNVLHSASMGLTSMEHWYGLPEALFEDRVIQDYPVDYNYQNEQHRFSEAGKLWKQAAKPYSPHWHKVMDELLALNFTLDPTFNIYEASRDLHRARRAEWHERYTLPALWRFYQPSRISHGSYWHFWGQKKK